MVCENMKTRTILSVLVCLLLLVTITPMTLNVKAEDVTTTYRPSGDVVTVSYGVYNEEYLYRSDGAFFYQSVDEITSDGDTTLISWADVMGNYYPAGEKILFSFSGSPGSNAINNVELHAMLKAETTSDVGFEWVVKDTSTWNSIEYSVTTSYTEKKYTMTINPLTSSAWTWGDISTLKAGIIQRSGTSGLLVTQYWMTISYAGVSALNPPYIPSNPSPVDGVIDVDTNVDLSWTGGDPDPQDTVTYNVYFGTTNPPLLISDNQSETTYDPGTLAYLTPYYWRIIAWDNHGASTVGPIWSFTTEVQPNQPPQANFIYNPIHPTTSDAITFTDTSSDTDGSIVIWLWNFNDGNISTVQNPTHQYSDDGIYQVSLTVTDDDNANSMITTPVTVHNIPPTADFTYAPENPTTLDLITFTDTSTDPDGTVVSWSWSFGDGSTSTLQNPTHTYAVAGTYTITLTVTDNNGNVENTSLSICVEKANPVEIIKTLMGKVGMLTLSKIEKKKLDSLLKDAMTFLTKKKPNSNNAIKELKIFIKEVRHLQKKNILTKNVGTSLIQDAQTIIKFIKITYPVKK